MPAFDELPDAVAWHILVGAARQAIESKGYKLSKMPGRGRSNVWQLTLNGKTQMASIRTSRDRWFAFPPLKKGSEWKTLDDVDVVIVAAVDSRDRPKKIEVYSFPVAEVRQKFAAAYAARTKVGNIVRDNFGMWVALDRDDRGTVAGVGSGLADEHRPVAVLQIDDLMELQPPIGDSSSDSISDERQNENQEPEGLLTISQVMEWARDRLAKIADVPREAVKLDLKIQH